MAGWAMAVHIVFPVQCCSMKQHVLVFKIGQEAYGVMWLAGDKVYTL